MDKRIFQKVKVLKTYKSITKIINHMIYYETHCLPPIDVQLDIILNP
jgi:hypothetical protein